MLAANNPTNFENVSRETRARLCTRGKINVRLLQGINFRPTHICFISFSVSISVLLSISSNTTRPSTTCNGCRSRLDATNILLGLIKLSP